MNDPLATRFGADADSPGLVLWRVTHRWQAVMRATLAPFQLTHGQFVLLAALAWLADHESDPPTQRRLAAFAEMDAMTTSQVVRALEVKDLVSREPHPDDARAHLVRLTDEGRRRVNAAIGPIEDADREFFARAPHLLAQLRQLA